MAWAIPYLRRRRAYNVRERKMSTDFTDAELKTQTRLTRYQFNYLLQRIEPLIASASLSSLTISADTKLLAVLSFLATGNFQWCVALSYGMTATKLGQFVGQVVTAINTLTPEFIHVPDEEMMRELALGFEIATGLPDLIGCIDGTLINIQAPSEGEAAYVDRKGNHSITCQLVCDVDMRIWDVNAQWPGSVHDSAVFNLSALKARFEANEFGSYKLLGDRGYGLQKYLLTVYRNPENELQERFNELHIKTRSVVERCIGLLKGRWRCLHLTGGEFVYTPEKVVRMFLAACILHNICLLSEDGLIAHDYNAENLLRRDEPENVEAGVGAGVEAMNARDEYVHTHEAVIMDFRARRRRIVRENRRRHERPNVRHPRRRVGRLYRRHRGVRERLNRRRR